MVHYRPEILMNIDNLLNTKLSQQWAKTHKLYEIIARVSGENIVFDGYDETSEKEKVIRYLTLAYYTVLANPLKKCFFLKIIYKCPRVIF